MRDDFRALAVFVSVADHGGFSGAARVLKLSPSAVTHHINRLEGMLGSAVFYRSTRSISLTPDGQKILEPARRMVDARNEAIDSLIQNSTHLVGSLKVSITAFGLETKLHQRILTFARENSQINLELHYTDAMVDIIAEGFDVAIRLGKLSDSDLKSRKIADFARILVASPHYLKSRPQIRTPDDLSHCEFLSFATIPNNFELKKGHKTHKVSSGTPRIQMNTMGAIRSAIKAGIGIQRLPASVVEDDLGSGALVRLLPDWSLPIQGVFAVWPNIKPERSMTRIFIDSISA